MAPGPLFISVLFSAAPPGCVTSSFIDPGGHLTMTCQWGQNCIVGNYHMEQRNRQCKEKTVILVDVLHFNIFCMEVRLPLQLLSMGRGWKLTSKARSGPGCLISITPPLSTLSSLQNVLLISSTI